MTIKGFSIDYDAINAPNIFSNGDIVTGRITVEVSSQTKIQSITFTAKGKATVQWTERHGQRTVIYHASEKYYKIQHTILEEGRRDGTEIISPGRHVFPFTFQIPNRDMPSTIKYWRGKIVHSLEAKLNRSMKMASNAKAVLTFVSKADMAMPGLMEPQYGTKAKDVVFFASGNISLNIHTERMGYLQGEVLKVIAEITNSSTRTVKPRFYLYEKKSAFARGQRRVDTKYILKDKGDAIASSTRQIVTKLLTIPPGLSPSILNCSILKNEYRLKVILDVALTKNPEIKLPIVILPDINGSASKELETYWTK